MKTADAVRLSIIVIAALAGPGYAQELVSRSPEGAEVYFIAPLEGDVVGPLVTVKFGLRGMGVAPAGVNAESTGHHHLLIDAPESVNLSQPLPATDRVLHFGKGQTETQITLPPGRHSLQLVLGNYLHIPHDPPVRSETIEIFVEGK